MSPFRAAFEAWHGAAAYDLTREPDDRWHADERTRNALHIFTAGFWAGKNPAGETPPRQPRPGAAAVAPGALSIADGAL